VQLAAFMSVGLLTDKSDVIEMAFVGFCWIFDGCCVRICELDED
jgi:hypothetical protein